MPKIVIDISEAAEAKLRHLAELETAAEVAAEQAGYGVVEPGSLEPFSCARRYGVEDVVVGIVERTLTDYASKGLVPSIPGDPMDDDLPF